jgi:WD40 repeat protein
MNPNKSIIPESHQAGERERRLDEVLGRYFEALETGPGPEPEEFLARFPDLAAELRDYFQDEEWASRWTVPLRSVTQALRSPPGPDAAALPAPGQRIGDCDLLAEVGRGGMGVVYRARQVTLNRVVALKMILAGAFASTEEVQRFRREAEAAAALDHPHIVPIYHVGEHDSRPYFTMKLVEGGSLAQKPPVATRGLVALMVKVARAVHHAHQRGVLHRDLKPGNILLDAAGEPHVTDFGLARRLSDDATLARSGALVGTPGYMAPEQAAVTPGGVSTAADVYGLGAVLYYLLTGRPPFHGPTPLDVLIQVREQEPDPPRRSRPEVPRDLETVCLKCLHKDPARRYPDAAALADDLQRFLDNEPVLARRPGVVERLARWGRRRPLGVALIAVSLLALVTAVAGMAWHTASLTEALSAVQEREGRLKEALAAGQEREREVRRHLYVADVRLSHQFFWKNGAIPAMRAQLGRHVTGPGDEDNREFAWHYLDHLLHIGQMRALRGHDGDVFGVAYAPDGRTLASVGADGTIRLWDPATLRQRSVLRGHQGAVRAVAFAPDGRTLATTGDDGTIRLWDPADGKERLQRTGHEGGAGCLAYSPDGRRLASGGRDKTIRIWDIAAGRELANHSRDAEIAALTFLGDGETLAGTDLDPGTGVELWTPGKKKPFGIVEGPGPHPWFFCVAAVPHSGEVVAGRSSGQLCLCGPGTTLTPFLDEESRLPVRAVAVSPDGRYATSGGDDSTVRVWDFRRRTICFIGKGHESGVWGVAFSPDGHEVASASADGTVRLWAWDHPQDHDTLRPALDPFGPMAFAADGRAMAAACRDGTVRLLDPTSWQEQGRLNAPNSMVRAIALSRNGQFAATSAEDRTLRFWDARSGRPEALLPCAAVGDYLAFSPDGTLLAVAGRDGSVSLRRRSDGREQPLFRLPGAPSALAFSPSGTTLAAATLSALVLWDMAEGKERARLSCDAGFESLAFLPDGRTLITAGVANRLAFWDVISPGVPVLSRDLLGDSPGVPHAITVSTDGRTIAVADASNIWIIDGASRRVRRRLNRGLQALTALGFCGDGRRLVGVGYEGRVFAWDLTSGTLDGPPDQHLAGVRALAFTPDGQTMLTGSHDPPPKMDLYPRSFWIKNVRSFIEDRTPTAVRLWDPATGRQRCALALPVAVSLECLALAPDGRTTAAGCSAGVIRLWDLVSRRELLTLFTNEADKARWQRVNLFLKAGWPSEEKFQTTVQAVAFSPNGQLLATANDDGRVQLWDTGSGRELRVLCAEGHTAALAFAPDGATLALGRDKAVELWDVASGQLRQSLDGHTAAVSALAYSADGHLLASGSQDWTVKLWDPAAAKERATLIGHRHVVASLAFSPDGRTLASGGHDRVVRLWHVATGQELLALSTTCAVKSIAFSPDGRTLAGAGEDPTSSEAAFLWRAPGLAARAPDVRQGND